MEFGRRNPARRSLRFEALEVRQMLSSNADFSAPVSMLSDTNTIAAEVIGAETSAASSLAAAEAESPTAVPFAIAPHSTAITDQSQAGGVVLSAIRSNDSGANNIRSRDSLMATLAWQRSRTRQCLVTVPSSFEQSLDSAMSELKSDSDPWSQPLLDDLLNELIVGSNRIPAL